MAEKRFSRNSAAWSSFMGRGNPLTPDKGDAPRLFSPDAGMHFDNLDKTLTWSGEAIRKTMEEELTVSADLRHVTHRVVLCARRPRTRQATLHISSHFDLNTHPDEDDIGVYDIEGAEVTDVAVETVDDGTSKIVTLLLPPGAPGDMQQVAYTHRFDFVEPVEMVLDRIFAWQLLYYSCRIVFEGGVPDNPRLQIVACKNLLEVSDGVEFTRPLTPRDNSVEFRLDEPYGMQALVIWDPPEEAEWKRSGSSRRS